MEDGTLPPTAAQCSVAATEDVASVRRSETRTVDEGAAAVPPNSGEQRQRDVAPATCPPNEQSSRGLHPDRSPPPGTPVVGLCTNLAPEVAHFDSVGGDTRGTAPTSVATSLLTRTLDVGERAGETRPVDDEAHKFQPLGARPGPENSLAPADSLPGVPSLSRRNSDVLAGDGAAQDLRASRLLKLRPVPTPPFNTPAASSPSVVASAEQNLANILSSDALSEGLLNEDVFAGASANVNSASEGFARAVVGRGEAEEGSNAGVCLSGEEEARCDDGVDATITREEETRRDNVVATADEGHDTLNILADMINERSKYYAIDAVQGIISTDPAIFSDDENDEVADEALVAWKTVRSEHAGHAPSTMTLDDETGQGSATATEAKGEVDRAIQMVPAGTELSNLVDDAAPPITPTTPINVTEANVNYAQAYVNSTGGDCVAGKSDNAVTADVDRVSFVPGEVTAHEPTTHGAGAASSSDNANLKRPFNQQNNPALQFNVVSGGAGAGDPENAPEMLGEKAVPYARPNPDSHTSPSSALSSASTIAKLSGVVASKARGETHPTEPHKSPKRVRYDAHGRGAYIPVSDDEVEVAASADEIHDDDSGGELTREPEGPAYGVLVTVANIASASKETIVKALDILMPAGLPKIESEADVPNVAEAGTTPQKVFSTEQVADIPTKLVNEPSAENTEAASGCQGRHADGVGFLNIVKDSIRSAAGKIGGEVPSVASYKPTQDIRVRGKAAVHLAGAEPEPEPSSSLRKRAIAAAQPKASTEAVKDSSRAKKDGADRFAWCPGYTLAAAGSILLVYVVVPLVVRAVTKP